MTRTKNTDVIYAVETHQIGRNHAYFKELDDLCFRAKNLYNSTLYAVRQHYFDTDEYLNYHAVNKMFTHANQPDYTALPAKVSKMVQQMVDWDFKSFFALLKKKQRGEYHAKTNLPRYADKVRGRKPVHYPKDALSFKQHGHIHLSKTNIYIKTAVSRDSIRYVKIVHCGSHIKILVGYDVTDEKVPQRVDNGRYASIDIGLNNLAVVSSNVMEPFIINGKPLKSINQYANKVIASLKSKLPVGVYTSKHIGSIYRKRANKIDDYMHKASTYIVNQLVSNNVNTLVIGENTMWKQDINIGRVNNQNFVCVPFSKFKDMLAYKCAMAGIAVVYQEESYTSKCSFYDNENIGKHDTYVGSRVKRGLFRTGRGLYVNADLNASLNILKKWLITKVAWNSKHWEDCVEVCSTPSIRVMCF